MSRPVLERIRTELVLGVAHYERRRRRRTAVVGAIAILTVVVGTGIAWNDSDGGDARVIVGPAGSGPISGLEEVPAPPSSGLEHQGYLFGVRPVWTGRELLAVGTIDDTGTVLALAFNPTTKTWRKLPAPPITPFEGSSAVWTGEELVICCGGAPDASAAAAYHPETDRWRSLPDAPITGSAAAVWTGDRVIAVSVDGAASLEPETGEWGSLPAPSTSDYSLRAAWTGRELIAWPSPPTRTVNVGESFDPPAGSWTPLPEPPEDSWPAIPEIIWIGDSLVVLGGLPAPGPTSERFVSSRYDPSTGAWTPLPDPLPEPDSCECNLGSHTSLWTGHDLLVHVSALASGASSDGVLLALDPADNSWRTLGDTSNTALTPLAMAGDRVLLLSEATGRYYLSDPGWRPAHTASPSTPSNLCPDARHPWQIGPGGDDESGDGLPPSGSATREVADRVLSEHGDSLETQYGAADLKVRVEDGRAWRRQDGSVQIVEEQVATVVVVVPSSDTCPSTPTFADGVPLTFEIRVK